MARYHRLQIWHRAMRVLEEVSQDIPTLRGEADLRDQIKRAARSTVANICEGEAGEAVGFRRPWAGAGPARTFGPVSAEASAGAGSETRSDKEFRRYLVIARASNAEVQSWYEMAQVAGLLDPERVAAVVAEIEYCGRSLSRFIAALATGP